MRGISIFDILNKTVERSSNVYWESSNSMHHSWSILSSDGRWRLGQYFIGEPQLNDLFEHPNGDTDVVERYPLITNGLREDFMQWRIKARQVDFTYHQLTSTGAAKIGGAITAACTGLRWAYLCYCSGAGSSSSGRCFGIWGRSTIHSVSA